MKDPYLMERAELIQELQFLRRELFQRDPNPGHVIDITDSGWVIKHPLSCRPNLFDCPYNTVVGWPELGQHVNGRFALDMDGGQVVIGEEV